MLAVAFACGALILRPPDRPFASKPRSVATMMLRDAAAKDVVSVGDKLQVAIETEEDGEVWAAATVQSVDLSGEFMVSVT